MTEIRTWKCEVCGYVHSGEQPPASCPVCGVDSTLFSPMEIRQKLKETRPALRWRCGVCDQVFPGEAPPRICPVCSAGEALFRPEDDQEPHEETDAALRVLVLGGGIAGVTAAEHARATSSRAEITLVNKEADPPYFRLNLTRYLAGEVEVDSLPLKARAWYEKQKIRLIQGEARTINPRDKEVTLKDGRILEYDRLVLATGAHPFIPPFPGASKAGVAVLRTLGETDLLLSKIRPGLRCICIGGGVLGLEAAAAMVRRGAAVRVLEGADWLLPRQLPQVAANLLQTFLEAAGVRISCGVGVKELLGDEEVRGVLLKDGTEIPADLVLISTGVRPNSYLARQCGLKVESGVLVDDGLFTSEPDILAAGDVAEHRGVVYGLWPAAYAQGAVAGINSSGGAAEFMGLPRSNRLKVSGVDLFSIGIFNPEDAGYQVFESLKEQSYYRLVLRDGHLAGAVLFGDTSQAGRIQEAVESKGPVVEYPDLLRQYPCLTGAEHSSDSSIKPEMGRSDIMASIKGTKTEQNLLKAFAGESQARNRYTYAAGVARKAGYLQIADLFLETAENEKEHAKRFFKLLEGGPLEITATYPAGIIDDTEGNLKAAAAGENEEWTELYPEFARVAREEGFVEAAVAFEMISRVEKAHEERFLKLLERVQKEEVFKRSEAIAWKCNNCGYIHEGPEAPAKCPACLHPQTHFQPQGKNY